MTDPIPTNEYIEVTAAEIAAYWRNEGRHIDVATAVEDDLTKEYAAKAIGTADILDTLLSTLEAEKKRADEAEARRKCYECGSEMTACAQCNPELVSAELATLRARVAELECALTEISKQTYGTEIWMDGDERAEILGRHLVRLRSLAFTAIKGASHEQ